MHIIRGLQAQKPNPLHPLSDKPVDTKTYIATDISHLLRLFAWYKEQVIRMAKSLALLPDAFRSSQLNQKLILILKEEQKTLNFMQEIKSSYRWIHMCFMQKTI